MRMANHQNDGQRKFWNRYFMDWSLSIFSLATPVNILRVVVFLSVLQWQDVLFPFLCPVRANIVHAGFSDRCNGELPDLPRISISLLICFSGVLPMMLSTKSSSKACRLSASPWFPRSAVRSMRAGTRRLCALPKSSIGSPFSSRHFR